MKKLPLRSILSSLAIFLIVFTFSCSRSVVTKQRPITDITALQKKTLKACNTVSKSNIRLKFKTTIEFDGKNHHLNGRIFLLSDTCVFVSVMSPAIGIEVARLFANTDSVLFINKTDKTFFSSDYDQFFNHYGLNFKLLYSIFSASYIDCDSVKFLSSNTQYFADMGYFVTSKVYYHDNSKSFSNTFFDSFGHIVRTEYKSANSDFLRVNYSNFALKDGFPGKMTLTLGVGGTKKEMEITIEEFSQLKKENIPNMKTDTRKYKRIYL